MSSETVESIDRPIGALASEEQSATTTRRRRMRPVRLLKWFLFLCVLGIAGYYLKPVVSERLQAYKAGDSQQKPSTYTVRKSRLILSATEDGNVESASNKEVTCPIEGGSTILWIVEDGKQVQEGDELVHLDASSIEDKLNSQKIVYGNALTSKIQAEKDVEVAAISIEEYLNGTYKKQIQDADAQITIAMENLRTAQNFLDFSERNSRKGFVTPLQLEADRFAVQRAQLELDSAQTAKMALEKFEKAKMLKDLESTLETAKAKLSSEEAALALEKSRLDRLQAQLDECILKAPQAGMVVYANDASRMRFGQSSAQIEEGAMVRERQTLIRLPDLKNMQVRVTVHESKVEQIRPGMPAKVVIGDEELKGTVVSVANQPEPGGWFSANIKEYATIVKIDDAAVDLKPGMSAEVTIFIQQLDDVLSVPVQCVVEQGRDFYCWRQTPTGPERQIVQLGATNDTYIQIVDGVSEGDEILLNPRRYVPEATQDESLSETVGLKDADAEKFGGGRISTGGADATSGRGSRPGGPMRKDGRKGGDSLHRASPDGRPSSATAPSDRSRGGGSSGPTGGGGQRGGKSQGNLMDYDKDGDGKVSKTEAPERVQPFFKFVDTNQDGFIDKQEADAAAARRASGRKRGSGGPSGESGRGPRDGGNSDGVPPRSTGQRGGFRGSDRQPGERR